MANLVNANSNKNYFQFHGSHYKYEKGVPFGLPISSSIFQNFLQSLEGQFTKSSTQSRALTHYPTGCPWRWSTPDLLIYFILLPFYGSGRSLWEPLMALTMLYASLHPLWPLPWNSWCSRDARISNDDSQRRVGPQAVIRCAQFGTTWPTWQWWRGCCTTPTNTLIC